MRKGPAGVPILFYSDIAVVEGKLPLTVKIEPVLPDELGARVIGPWQLLQRYASWYSVAVSTVDGRGGHAEQGRCRSGRWIVRVELICRSLGLRVISDASMHLLAAQAHGLIERQRRAKFPEPGKVSP